MDLGKKLKNSNSKIKKIKKGIVFSAYVAILSSLFMTGNCSSNFSSEKINYKNKNRFYEFPKTNYKTTFNK